METTTLTPTRTPAETTSTALAMRVILRLWGCTPDDLWRAEENARNYQYSNSWAIVEVIPSTGTPCPIPMRDPIALNQNAIYDAAWAAYPAGRA
jgi:hypothetical protein